MKSKKKVISKIKSLLSLSDKTRNDSDSAANLALSKAHELLAKHQLRIDEVHDFEEDDLEEEILGSKVYTQSSQFSAKTRLVLSILKCHFYIQQFYYTHTVLRKRRVILVFIGRESTMEVAKDVFHFLSDEFDRHWKEHKPKK